MFYIFKNMTVMIKVVSTTTRCYVDAPGQCLPLIVTVFHFKVHREANTLKMGFKIKYVKEIKLKGRYETWKKNTQRQSYLFSTLFKIKWVYTKDIEIT